MLSLSLTIGSADNRLSPDRTGRCRRHSRHRSLLEWYSRIVRVEYSNTFYLFKNNTPLLSTGQQSRLYIYLFISYVHTYKNI